MSRREMMLAYGAWLAVCLIWGTTYLAIRVAVRTIPDAWLAGVRFVIAGSLLSVILRLRGEKFPPFSQWKHLALVGVLLIGVGNWFVVWAEKFVPSGPTALLVATLPFWMVFIESMLAGRVSWLKGQSPSLGRRQILGLIIGFGGVLLLVYPKLREGLDSRFLTGVIGLQIATAAWSLGSVYSKYKKVDAGPLVSAALQMLMGGFLMCIVALLKGDFSHAIAWDRSSLFAFFYLLIAGSMIAYVCYIYALSKLQSSLVSLYGYINPLIAVWLGWLILNEEVAWTTILATAVILFGSWMVRRNTS